MQTTHGDASTLFLLGPQRQRPTVGSVLSEIGVAGPVAVVSAGWQEREEETAELAEHLATHGCRTVPLALHLRCEAVFAADPELAAAHRERQDRLRDLQGLYRLQLRHRMDAVRELMGRRRGAAVHVSAAGTARADDLLLDDARQSALTAVRELDDHHLATLHRLHADFTAARQPWQRPAVAAQRDELAALLSGCAALAVAGGHAAVLLNRLRLFSVLDLAAGLPILAWSAGAMVLAERVVLFHDTPPQGPGNAEVLEAGLGCVAGLLPLPHADRRLRLDDPLRVALLARRFAPDDAVALDAGGRLRLDGGRVTRASGCRRLTAAGRVVPYRPAAGAAPRTAAPWPEPPGAAERTGPAAAAPPPPTHPLAIRQLAAAEPLDAAAVDAFLDAHLAANGVPIREGTTTTFLWRGEADEVHLQHWIYGLPSSQPFERLGDTDLWFLVLEIPQRSRIEYKLRLVAAGEEHWLRDPLNPHEARDPFGANSVFHGLGYAPPEWTRRDPSARRGSFEEMSVASAAFGAERHLRVYLPARFRPSRRYPLLVVHDGEDYARYSNLAAVLDNLIHRGEVAPLIVALSQAGERLEEYADDPRHARFLADELLPTLEERYPLRPEPAVRGLMGASFGAVAALAAAWRRPGVFGRLLLQSGSFAFSDLGERHGRGEVFDPVVRFMNELREEPRRPAEKAFVGCGIYESLIYENRSLVPLLQGAGMEVRFREGRDGHNWQGWRDQLREGLSWLFPGELWMVYE